MYIRKPVSLPKMLIYSHPNGNDFTMISTKNGDIIGKASCQKRLNLFIEYLKINPKYQRQGFGTKFLRFAGHLSEKLGLGGRLQVLASVLGSNREKPIPPHIFYRKNGFTANNKDALKLIDEKIKNNELLKENELGPLYMYFYPQKLI